MSSAFLLRFSTQLTQRLLSAGLIEIEPGTQEQTIAWLATRLATRHPVSLVSTVAGALLACPTVIEVYADDNELKHTIEELGPTAVRA